MKEETKKILKTACIIFVVYIVISVGLGFFSENNSKMEIISLILPGIVILAYAYQRAKKEDSIALQTVFVFLVLNEILKIISRFI